MGQLPKLLDIGPRKLPEAKLVSYYDLRPEMDNFDVLVWAGKGFGSTFIQHSTGSWCSHVSLIMRTPEFDMVLNFESTTRSHVKDVFVRKERSGSQVNGLSDRLRNYNGRVFYRKLYGTRTVDMLRRFEEIRLETSGIKYEHNWWEFVKSGIWFLKNKEDRSSLFCSELAAWSFHSCNITRNVKPSNEHTPEDFTTDKTCAGKQVSEHGLHFLGDHYLGEEIEIDLSCFR